MIRDFVLHLQSTKFEVCRAFHSEDMMHFRGLSISRPGDLDLLVLTVKLEHLYHWCIIVRGWATFLPIFVFMGFFVLNL